MKKISLCIILLSYLQCHAQTDSLKAIEEITAFQKKLNEEYKDSKESPLDAQAILKFGGHEFFPINLQYRVNATLTVSQGTPFFEMKTSSPRPSVERIYGYVSFTLQGKEFNMPVYQSKKLMQTTEYEDYLFFPFTDKTNDYETYAGGRYIDLRIPDKNDKLVIDFNRAYNPYCAYSGRFSCPLVPPENQMEIEVPVGVKYPKDWKLQKSTHVQDTVRVYKEVDVLPEYAGGNEAMFRFIRTNMKYPRSAIKQKISGTVYIQFIVTPEGFISDVQTIKGISRDCDLEAERVVMLMPKWKPGQLNGKNVYVRFILPIKFKG
jgi:TonB family protein